MICPMVPFRVTLSDLNLDFEVTVLYLGLWVPSTYCVRSWRATCLR